MKPWYETAFHNDYLDRYPRRNQDEADRDIDRVLRLLAPDPADAILDLGCGAGRHLIALWNRGYRNLAGLDLSAELLETARARLSDCGAEEIELWCCDMRSIPASSRFQIVLSMFTSFGYFPSDKENERVAASVRNALGTGGIFLIDTLERARTIAGLVPKETQRIQGRSVSITRAISADGRRVEKAMVFEEPDGTELTVRESVRMYTDEELRAMLLSVGFSTVSFYGSLLGTRYTPGAPRLVAVAVKGPA